MIWLWDPEPRLPNSLQLHFHNWDQQASTLAFLVRDSTISKPTASICLHVSTAWQPSTAWRCRGSLWNPSLVYLQLLRLPSGGVSNCSIWHKDRPNLHSRKERPAAARWSILDWETVHFTWNGSKWIWFFKNKKASQVVSNERSYGSCICSLLCDLSQRSISCFWSLLHIICACCLIFV